MIVLVVILAVLAIAAFVATLVTRSRLKAQRALAASTAEARDAAIADAEQAKTAAEQARTETEQARTETEEALAAAEQARTETAAAAAERDDAQARADQAEAARTGLDANLLWHLEQARSERTWRHSVAVGPDATSVFDGADNPLREALQVDLDAAREEVGAIVELDFEVPAEVTTAGSVLAVRAAQELLARAVKTAEESTVRVRADGEDLIVTIECLDEDGQPVELTPLPIPESFDLEAADGGVRIKRAVRVPE